MTDQPNDYRDPARMQKIITEILYNIDKHEGITVREVFDIIGSVIATKISSWPEQQRNQLLTYLSEVVVHNLQYFDDTIKRKFN